MASVPFLPDQTLPEDNDIVSQFPAVERTFRDEIESWLLLVADTYGHVKAKVDTTANRDTDVNWSAGNLFINSTLKCLQRVESIGPVVWVNVDFPTGTSLPFEQASPPTGWTKKTAVAYADAAFRCMTSYSGTGGTAAFSAAFTARTIAQANLPNVNLAATSLTVSLTNGTNVVRGAGLGNTASGASGFSAVSGSAIQELTATAGGNVPLGGSGTAMDFAVKFIDLIVATKD